MKSIEILAIGIRLVGVFALLLAFSSMSKSYITYQESLNSSSLDFSMFGYVSLGQGVILLIASLVMFKFPITLSKWLLPKTKEGKIY